VAARIDFFVSNLWKTSEENRIPKVFFATEKAFNNNNNNSNPCIRRDYLSHGSFVFVILIIGLQLIFEHGSGVFLQSGGQKFARMLVEKVETLEEARN